MQFEGVCYMRGYVEPHSAVNVLYGRYCVLCEVVLYVLCEAVLCVLCEAACWCFLLWLFGCHM